MKAKYIIGGLIIVVFMVWGASAFLRTTIRYVSIEEASTATQTVQTMGKIDFDKVTYNVEDERLEFVIYDAEAEDKESARTMDVLYYGVVPGNFDQATSVVLKGKAKGEAFLAEQMLVKCPSKYQGEGGNEFQNIEKHNRATDDAGV